MKKIWISSFLVSSICITSCKVSDKSKANSAKPEAVIETIGGQSVNTSDFKYVYNKNNSNSPDAYSDKSVREYLSLYTNFRLKVQEGEKLGLDTTLSFRNELDGYKKQLAQPYLKEKEVTDRLIKEAYDRMKEEVKASHILIKLAEDAEPKDTLAAYNEIMDIRKKALAGEDFGKLAKSYSQDPSAQTNKGDLGYFTALQMVYPFENAAYNTKPGDISTPVRTRFGYHILKVYDRRPSQGQVKVAHIMIRYNEGGSVDDSTAARNRVNEISAKLSKGEDWDLLCAQFSEDSRTKGNKGELDWFGTNQMFAAFEEAAFKLQNKGDVTPVAIQSPYGFHLIKLIDKKGLESFAKMEPQLKTKVSKDSRSEVNQQALLSRLRTENNLVENKKSYDWALSKADSNLTLGKWSFNATDKEVSNTLFSIKDQKYTINDFFDYVKSNQAVRYGHTPGFLMASMYKAYVNSSLISYEEAHLENKYQDYRMLVKEYRDGILLFQLMEDNVWTKAITDTVGLKKYFSENREKYKWGERADVVIYNAANQQVLDETKVYLKQNLYPVNDVKVENITFTKTAALTESEKKQLDQVAVILAKDKHLYAQFTLEYPKTEKVTLTKARLKEVKSYLKTRGADSTRLTINSLSGPATLKNALATVKLYSDSKKALERLLNKGNALNLQITEGKFEKNTNEFLNQTNWKVGESTVDFNSRRVLIIVKNIEPARSKEFEETRGQVISDYQNYLEKTWLEKLRAQNPVVVNEEQVKTLIKQ